MAQSTGLQFTVKVGALADNTFAVASFKLDEGLNRPFNLHLEVASQQPDIDFGAVLDQPCELLVWYNGELQRRVCGVVSEFTQGDSGFRRTRYSLQVRPALWRLGLRQNSRIFQAKKPDEILSILLQEHGITDYAFALKNEHAQREYCVQYRETDLDFMNRLAAEEGLFYFHEFEQGKHRIVFADDAAALTAGPELFFNLGNRSLEQGPYVRQFHYREAVRPSDVELKDYSFKTPAYGLSHKKQGAELEHQRDTYQHFDYPGRYKQDGSGKAFAQHRLDALRNDAVAGSGKSNSAALLPGQRFSLTEHPNGSLNTDWQIVRILHTGEQPQALEEEGGSGPTVYHNEFGVVKASTTWRARIGSPEAPHKPMVDGPQIAIVVGPEGEEIYCDEHGRVKLQLPWDRYGSSNDQSSCWVRVSQGWAGGQYGMMAIPRIGHEVIVEFLEGDPDQPIVTGRTFHATNRPPYELPANKTRTVLRTETHQGDGFNELRFEDQAGQEEIYIHGQKDLNVLIQNDAAWHIKHDEHRDIDNERVTRIKANDHLTVEGEKRDHIKADYSLTVDVSLHQKLAQSLLVEAGQEVHIKAGNKIVLEAGSELTLKVGGSFVKVDPSGVTLVGPTIKMNSGGAPGRGTKSAPRLPDFTKAVAEEIAPVWVGFTPVPAQLETPALQVVPLEEEEEEEESSPLSVLRIGVFFDGTANNTNKHLQGKEVIEAFLAQCEDPDEREQLRQQCASGQMPLKDNSAANDITNVGKMHDLYLRDSRESLTVPVYISGIGTEDGEGDAWPGLGFDRGETSSKSKVELACRSRIVEEIKTQLGRVLPTLAPIEKIEFDVFGFSRGASAARQFVNTIDLQDDHPLVESMAGLTDLTLKDGFNWASREDVRIRFVGLLDTVVTSQSKKRNVTLKPDSAERVVHLIARDEWRMNFALTRIVDDTKSPQIAPNFTELIIPGAHSDVGGGYYSRWSMGSPQKAQPVLTENKVIRAFEGSAEITIPTESTPMYHKALAYAKDRVREGWAQGVTVLPTSTSSPVLGHLNIKVTDAKTTSSGIGIAGLTKIYRDRLVEVILHRVVEGEYSRIPLHMIVEAARTAGVPFAEWDVTDTNLKLTSTATPHPQVNLAKLDESWVDAGKQAGVFLDLTKQLPEQVYRQLRFEYLHYSADTGMVNYPNVIQNHEVRRVISNQEGGK